MGTSERGHERDGRVGEREYSQTRESTETEE